MVRYEDPPGAVKHIVFGGIDPDNSPLVQSLKLFPGVKVGVIHLHGKKSERPHIHVWYEVPDGKEVTNVTVKNWLKAHDPLFTKLKGQQQWSFRNHDSLEDYADYVMKNDSAIAVINHIGIELESRRPPIKIADPVMGTNVPFQVESNKPYYLLSKPKKLSMREQFIAHLEGQGWVHTERNPSVSEVIHKLYHFWEGAFAFPEGERMVRHAMYLFSDGETREKHIQSVLYNLQTKFNF